MDGSAISKKPLERTCHISFSRLPATNITKQLHPSSMAVLQRDPASSSGTRATCNRHRYLLVIFALKTFY